MSALSDRLAEAKGDRSIDAIAAQAEQRGYRIDRATVGRYIQGKHAKEPPEHVLEALAEGLGVDLRELRELAGVPRGELGQYEPPAESARLNHEQRQAIDHLIKAIVKEKDDDAQKMNSAAGEATEPGSAADTQQGKGQDNESASAGGATRTGTGKTPPRKQERVSGVRRRGALGDGSRGIDADAASERGT